MTSHRAVASMTEERSGEVTSRAGRRALRRTARRRTCCRVAGLVGVLVLGVSGTAAGLSTDPTRTPLQAGAAETTDLRDVDFAVARRSVSARPVEGVLLTHAATVRELERIAAGLAAAQAAQAAARAEAMKPRTGVNWDAIAECETGGNWSMQGSSYSGGVGFANTTWSGFGGGEFAPNAGQASREEQIVVAERVYDEYGLSGWGCRAAG